MIKIVFIDIDGTLLNSKREVSKKTIEIIKKCKEKGIYIVITSGRSKLETLYYKKLIDASNYIISSNGAEVYDCNKDRVIYNRPIEKNIVMKLYDYAEKNNDVIKLIYDKNIAVNKIIYNDDINIKKDKSEIKEIIKKHNIVQCVILNKNINNLYEFKEFFVNNFNNLKIENESKKLKNSNEAESDNYYCDVVKKDVSKGNAVEILYKYLNIDISQTAAIGDSFNDISMFKKVGISVAMKNAVEEVKKEATIITETNNNDGVAKFLEKLL